MKRSFAILFLLFFITCTYSQQLSQVTFSNGSDLSYFSFMTDQGVLIRVTDKGELKEWGYEVRAQRFEYYAPQLQPFMGRIEYFGPEADSAFRGKVRSVGTCFITYYGSYESDSRPGKVRSIGSLLFDYHSNFANKAYRGKIRFAGNLIIEYHSSFDDEILRGKIRSIGNTVIKYYSVFEDKFIQGKIKSIGSFNYSWYNSFEQAGLMKGSLKGGFYRQNIGGITYILR